MNYKTLTKLLKKADDMEKKKAKLQKDIMKLREYSASKVEYYTE